VISRRFGRGDSARRRPNDDDNRTIGEQDDFPVERTHERRIHSWSPDPYEDEQESFDDDPGFEDEVAAPPPIRSVEELRPPPQAPPPVERTMPPRVVAAPPAAPARDLAEPAPVVAPAEPAPVVLPEALAEARQPAATQPGRRRGRPRGRPRRQVHFHVDPDEELLLLRAVELYGSQQKGLIAALQALQDNEILRDEIERLRTECERQRVLLAEAEAIFNR
jgi:hypothetical protein